MKNNKYTATHKEILDYWLPIINSKDGHKYAPHPIDGGEPTCWACGKYWDTKYDSFGKYDLTGTTPYYKLWAKAGSKLERCHIVAKSLGGSNEPSNLFIMCKECHILSPDITDPKYFFKWVLSRKGYMEIYGDKILEASDALGFDYTDKKIQKKINSLFTNKVKNKKFHKYLAENTTIHAGHGLSMTSMISAIMVFCE